MRYYIVFFIFSLTSCYTYREITPTEGYNREVFELKMKDQVSTWIDSVYQDTLGYENFGYGDVLLIPSKVIRELESFKKDRKNTERLLQSEYSAKNQHKLSELDTTIFGLERFIKENKISHHYLINHIFKTSSSGPNHNKITEIDFIFDESPKIVGAKEIMTLNLDVNDYFWFGVFMRHETLIYPREGYESETEKMNQAYYDDFYNQLNNSGSDKARTLKKILLLVENVKTRGHFDYELICRKQIKLWVKNSTEAFKDYTPIKFGVFEEFVAESDTNDISAEILGYSLDHTFIAKRKGTKKKYFIHYDFNAYFEITNATLIKEEIVD